MSNEKNTARTPGERMKTWRLSQQPKLSQHEISLRTNIPVSTLSRYENDAFYPELRNAQRLAEVSNGALPVEMWNVEKPPEAAPVRRRAAAR